MIFAMLLLITVVSVIIGFLGGIAANLLGGDGWESKVWGFVTFMVCEGTLGIIVAILLG